MRRRATPAVVGAPEPDERAERVGRPLRQECPDHVVGLGERHLQAVLQEYLD